jgi:hypothetical protein
MEWFWDQYLPDVSKRADIHVSPINATSEQLKGLPQTLLFVDENDVLRDEGEAYGRKLGMRTFWPSGSKAPRRHLYLSRRVGLFRLMLAYRSAGVYRAEYRIDVTGQSNN